MKLYFCLTLMFLGVSAEYHCILFPGWLTQIDASVGQLYGVNLHDNIYRLNGNEWIQVPGKLIHVSPGPCGVWGTDRQNRIYKMQDGNWVQVEGSLNQLDAGGRVHFVGVNSFDDIYCLNQDDTLSRGSNLPFQKLDGKLKYYSCGLYGCWGVDSSNNIFHRLDVSSTNCRGSVWRQVEGKMNMVEAATDGSVFGINTVGNIYKREGITASNTIGTHWSVVNIDGPFKHVSYDERIMWLLNQEGNIFKCQETFYYNA